MVRPFQQVPKYLSIFPLFLFFSSASAQSSIEPPLLDIVIPHGSLNVKGTSAQQIEYGISDGQESLIALLAGTPNAQLFVKPETLPSASIQLQVPKKQNLFIQSDKASITISDIESNIEGQIETGAISIQQSIGNVSLFTHNGDVVLHESSLTGIIGTGRGNVLIKDVSGHVQGYSQEGKVTRKFTNKFFQNSTFNQAFELSLKKTDLIVESLPSGGNLYIEEGQVQIDQVQGHLQLQTLKSSVNINSLKGSLTATANEGNMNILADSLPAGSSLQMIHEKGNITLYLASNFDGTISIEQSAYDELKHTYTVESEFNLGNDNKQQIVGEEGKIIAYQNSIHKKLGNSDSVINIKITDGNLIIKKL